MATIVSNVKERLRSRSRHRYSASRGQSIDDTRPPLPSVAISGWQHSDLPKTLRQEALAEPGPREHLVPVPSKEDTPSATSGGQGLGFDPGVLAEPVNPASSRVQQGPLQSFRQNVPDRYSSLRKQDRPLSSEWKPQGHRRAISQPFQRPQDSDVMASSTTPPSRPKSRHVPIASTSPQLSQYEADVASRQSSQSSVGSSSSNSAHSIRRKPVAISKYPPRKDSLEQGEPPRGRMPGHRTKRSLELAPNDPSPLVPRYDDKEHEMLATAGSRQAMAVPDDIQVDEPVHSPGPIQMPDNMHLPEGFQLESYIRTEVTTDWAPAVTQEVIHDQKIQIIQEEITRDIHIHHYYEYFQPIKVLEIAPARHWFLDHKTGKKIEIPEPTGWKPPKGLRPYRPDTSTITKKTRHYLVNDEHPEGKFEPASEPPDEAHRRQSVSSAAASAAPAA